MERELSSAFEAALWGWAPTLVRSIYFSVYLILTHHEAGGSIRVPAAFNNLYGIRPSHGRLPYAKMANSMEGQETIHSVCGPITHSIDDMRLFMKAVLQEQPWSFDSKVVPMPWRTAEEEAIRKKISSGCLTLGVYRCDGNVSLGPVTYPFDSTLMH